MRRGISIAALGLTWIVLFYTLTMLTELVLVPWDTALVRPEVGTWQRSLNDFFETGPGQFSIAAGLISLSMLLARAALRRRPESGFRLAAINLLFIVALLPAFVAAALVNNLLFPYPPVMYDPTFEGYHRSVLPGAVIALLCVGWFLMQRRVAGRHANP